MSTLQPWQERVVAEKQELDDRLGRLTGFIGTAAFARLHFFDRHLMVLQYEHTAVLSNILQQRIERFSATDAPEPRVAADDADIRRFLAGTRLVRDPRYAEAVEAGWRAAERHHRIA